MDIYEHSSGLLYIGTGIGLFTFDRSNKKVREIHFSEIEDPSSKRVHTICEDEFGNLFVGTEYTMGGLFYLDLGKNRNYQFTVSSIFIDREKFYNVYSIQKNKQHQLLFATVNGLYEFELDDFYKKNKDEQLKYNCSFEEFTSAVNIGQPVYSFEFDNHSNIWIGTNYLAGLQYYLHDQDSILNLDIQSNSIEKFQLIAVMSIFKDRSGVFG